MNAREEKYFCQGLLEGKEYGAAGKAAIRGRVDSLAALCGLSEGEAVRRVVDGYHHRLDAVPSLTKFPELAGMRECVLAYDRGLVQTSGLDAEEIIIFRNYLYTVTQALRTGPATPPNPRPSTEPGCTLVYFPHSDRGPLLGNNTDDLLRPDFQTPPVWPVANKSGLILGTVSSGIHDDEVSSEIFPAPVFLMVYEMCANAAEAAELLTRLNLFWGPCNCLVADSKGGSVVIEKSSCRYGLRESPDGFSATTAMAAEEPGFKDYLWQNRTRSLKARGLDESSVDWAYWKAAERRSSRLLQMLEAARDNPGYAEMEAIVYDHTGFPDQMHLDGGRCHPDEKDPNWTLRTVVHVINEGCSFYSYPEPPRGGHLTPRLRKDYVLDEPIF